MSTDCSGIRIWLKVGSSTRRFSSLKWTLMLRVVLFPSTWGVRGRGLKRDLRLWFIKTPRQTQEPAAPMVTPLLRHHLIIFYINQEMVVRFPAAPFLYHNEFYLNSRLISIDYIW